MTIQLNLNLSESESHLLEIKGQKSRQLAHPTVWDRGRKKIISYTPLILFHGRRQNSTAQTTDCDRVRTRIDLPLQSLRWRVCIATTNNTHHCQDGGQTTTALNHYKSMLQLPARRFGFSSLLSECPSARALGFLTRHPVRPGGGKGGVRQTSQLHTGSQFVGR